MTDLPKSTWSAKSYNVAAYDFTTKKMRPHWTPSPDIPHETILLQNYQRIDILNLVCGRCGHGWTDGIPMTMRMSQVECPYCKYAGSVVRS